MHSIYSSLQTIVQPAHASIPNRGWAGGSLFFGCGKNLGKKEIWLNVFVNPAFCLRSLSHNGNIYVHGNVGGLLCNCHNLGITSTCDNAGINVRIISIMLYIIHLPVVYYYQ
jgi:hypothetical protein